jgi:murein L,D-transpeptidase YafK
MRRALTLLLALGLVFLTAFVVAPRDAGRPLPDGVVADHVLVSKSDRMLSLFSHGRKLKSYHVAFGRQPVGKKVREGDDRTPEGKYFIDRRNVNSKYHLALHVSYPNADDTRRARAGGYSPGGDIMIHGLRRDFGWIGGLHRALNWTHGCIAVTDAEIDEIGRAVRDGTPIEILP